ncbi:hypothetical protein [Aeromicrobium sp. UC242_57]|uniref:hypothetical protein n=1 Tax=Aeromicrobium sp. UC242_57 TaxID=3374624 RepID=UPI0037A1590F
MKATGAAEPPGGPYGTRKVPLIATLVTVAAVTSAVPVRVPVRAGSASGSLSATPAPLARVVVPLSTTGSPLTVALTVRVMVSILKVGKVAPLAPLCSTPDELAGTDTAVPSAEIVNDWV